MRWVSARSFLASAESRSIDGASHRPNPTMRRGLWTAIVEREQKDDAHLAPDPNARGDHSRPTDH